MPNNDEVVLGIPSIQCPSCYFQLDMSGTKIEKYTKAQRKRFAEEGQAQWASADSQRRPDVEDLPSNAAEKVLVVVTCSNPRCEQYNKIKVLKLPRITTASVKVDLGD